MPIWILYFVCTHSKLRTYNSFPFCFEVDKIAYVSILFHVDVALFSLLLSLSLLKFSILFDLPLWSSGFMFIFWKYNNSYKQGWKQEWRKENGNRVKHANMYAPLSRFKHFYVIISVYLTVHSINFVYRINGNVRRHLTRGNPIRHSLSVIRIGSVWLLIFCVLLHWWFWLHASKYCVSVAPRWLIWKFEWQLFA